MKKLFYLLSFLLLMLTACNGNRKETYSTTDEPTAPAFCEDSAYAYIAAQCQFGPRTMNSAAHDACGDWIAQKFEDFGATVYRQYADGKLHNGTTIKIQNIIAAINPEAEVRIILSGHWDSRPWADNDEDESLHNTPIDGANDGGSGIGIMLEVARQIQLAKTADSATVCGIIDGSIGVDFICWDAEDSGSHGANSSSTWCLGSQYWAGVRHVEGYTARYGINLDMVGSAKTVFCKEGVSMHFAPTLVDRIWSTAQRLGYGNYFKNEECGEMIDDHLHVNRGGIPCVDIIGLDAEEGGFPSTWHTMGDNLSNINKPTLKAVGQTMLEVLWNEK